MVGALDQRVKAVVAQVPACGNTPPPDCSGKSLFSLSMREVFVHGTVKDEAPVTGPLPVVSFDQASAPSLLTPLTAFRWFVEYGGRYRDKLGKPRNTDPSTDARGFSSACFPRRTSRHPSK